MFISGNSETGVPELNLASIPNMGSPEGLRHFSIHGDKKERKSHTKKNSPPSVEPSK
jgi:hypothetical protein